MNKINVTINHCKVGEVIAEDVLNKLGVVLVPKNTIINHFIKAKLSKMQIPYVCIYQPTDQLNSQTEDFGMIYKEAVLTVKELLNEVSISGKIDYDKVKSISEILTGSFNETSHIIDYLAEIKNSDEYTYTHSINVAFYSMLLAKWLHLSDTQIQEAILAGLLHDIGKMRVPTSILNKKGKLTTAEYEVIKKHSQYGYEIIKDIPEISTNIKSAILSHHERFDGTGYPSGLSGNNINLHARIIAITDVFDAMTQNRVYKKKVSPFETLKMFQTIGITNYDPTLLNTFLSHIAPFYVGTNVILNNGDTGEIVFIPLHDITNPVIKVGERYINLSLEKELMVTSVVN